MQDHIPNDHVSGFNLRSSRSRVPLSRTVRYDNSFFPYCIKQWNDLDDSIKTLPTVKAFKSHIFEFIRPKGHSFFVILDEHSMNLLTKIRVEFSDLREHRYNHNFNCISAVCRCGIEDESSTHFFLCCPRVSRQRSVLLSKVSDIINSDVNVLPKQHFTQILLYGSNVFNEITNRLILNQSMLYIKNTKRFNIVKAFS